MAKHTKQAVGRHAAHTAPAPVLTVAKAEPAHVAQPEPAPEPDPLQLELGLAVDDALDEAADFAMPASPESAAPVAPPAPAVEQEANLWPDVEVIPEEAALARHYSDRLAPKRRRRRRRPTLKGFIKGIFGIILFLLISAIVATLVGAAVYMYGTQTPLEEMPAAVWAFYVHLFS